MPPPAPQQHHHDKFLDGTANVLVYANRRHLLPWVYPLLHSMSTYSDGTVTAVTGDTIACLHKCSRTDKPVPLAKLGYWRFCGRVPL